MPKFRNSRIQEEMKKEIDRIIREDVDDPRLDATFSVTRADVSGDLRHAKVYVSVLEDGKREELLKGLKSAAGFIRRELTRRMSIRYTPELQFVADDNIAYGIHISQLLKQVGADSGKAEPKDDGQHSV